MKRIAGLILTLALLGNAAPSPGPAPEPAPAANYDALGLTLLGTLAGGANAGNVFISPLSIGVALGMASDGAAGATRDAMRKTLGLSGDSSAANANLIAELKANDDAKVGIANALWLRADAPPLPAYVAHLQSVYAAKSAALHFGDPSAAAAINAWTKDNTLGLIDHLVDDTQPSDVLYLTNALAFVGKWSTPFEKSATQPGPFTEADGTSAQVPMMSRTGEFETADGDGFRTLRMPYGKGGYAAYILMPASGKLADFVRTLDAAHFAAAANSLTSQRLHVEVPRFTARYKTSLNQPLAAAGMGVAFSGGADFSNIRTTSPRVAISNVEHATYLSVDEAGTTAAAATSIGFRALAMPATLKQFIVDKPFVFAIRDEKIGALLFVGAIGSIPAASSP